MRGSNSNASVGHARIDRDFHHRLTTGLTQLAMEPGSQRGLHLVVKDMALQKASEHDVFGGPSARYCPAGVYEWVEEAGNPKFVINAQNCVHCKTCDIKDPNQNITSVPPEGSGGPNYPNM